MTDHAKTATTYEERLTVPRSWWVMCAGLGISTALIFLPYGPAGLLSGLVAGSLLTGTACSAYGNPRIRIVAESLVAGDARIPLRTLGEVDLLDAQEAQAWRTYKADHRAFMLLRGYISTAVRVEVADRVVATAA